MINITHIPSNIVALSLMSTMIRPSLIALIGLVPFAILWKIGMITMQMI